MAFTVKLRKKTILALMYSLRDNFHDFFKEHILFLGDNFFNELVLRKKYRNSFFFYLTSILITASKKVTDSRCLYINSGRMINY